MGTLYADIGQLRVGGVPWEKTSIAELKLTVRFDGSAGTLLGRSRLARPLRSMTRSSILLPPPSR